MTTLIFVRHGETAWSRARDFRFRGRRDIPLTELGVNQAQAVGSKLQTEKVSAIYSSPLMRARDTAKEIAKFHNIQVVAHPGFIDLNFGTWQGEQHRKLQEEQPELYNRWLDQPHTMEFPDGETLTDVRRRIEDALTDLVTRHENETIVIATHGAVLRVLLCFLHNVGNENYWKFTIDNCALIIVKFEHGKYSIIEENDNEHLIGLEFNK